MKFLIVGASGFVGSHTLAYVHSLGHKVVGTQSRSKHPGLIPFDLLEHRIEDRVGKDFFQRDEPVFGVICSAICQIDRCREEQRVSYKVNVEQTTRLIEDLVDLGAKPVFLSSDAVFDGKQGYYIEEHRSSPINEYGRQKAEVENYLQRAVANGLTIRLSKIVGDDPTEMHLFSEWYHWIEEKRPITCIEGQIFSPTFVDDVARGIVLGCERGLSGLYNVANPEFFSREELAKQFVSSLGRNVDVVSKPQREFGFLDLRPEKTYLDSTRFLKATGMKFSSMREVIQSFIRNTTTCEGG